jgi:hypothetical protein
MKKSAVKRTNAGNKSKSKMRSSNVTTESAAVEENVCDAVHRVIRKAKTVTPAIRSLKSWYAANC